MPGIKEVKHSTKTASSDSKSEDLHDGSLYIVRTPNKIYDSFKERMRVLPLSSNQVIYRTIQRRLAQSYTKDLALISEQF